MEEKKKGFFRASSKVHKDQRKHCVRNGFHIFRLPAIDDDFYGGA